MSNNTAIRIHPADCVAVALSPLSKGATVELPAQGNAPSVSVRLAEDITAGHKFALHDIAEGQEVIKYGYPIGSATKAIGAGEWVHTHNVRTLLSGEKEYSYDREGAESARRAWQKENEGLKKNVPSIRAYRRTDGKIGIRNEIWIVPTVGCVNKLSEKLAAWGNEALCGGNCGPKEEGGLEGIYTWIHPYGCSQMGGDKEATAKILAALVKHPNAGGVLVLSLGCEENNLPYFTKYLGEYDKEKVRFMVAQDHEDEVAEGKRLLTELASHAATYKREEASLADITLGMKCGGSDGMSGITANALVGRVCDALTAMGGTVMLTEVPEMFGAEQMLMNRCVNHDVFDQTVKLINGFKGYYESHHQVCYENPSPGNKAGGITTLEDKSLGCVQKGGRAPVCGVIPYGGQVQTK
ncbi:MAG: altronate dehydratase family protein, partial [Treponema sp.]|nr:altronate dehydratase family protein [Treponema sp.]